MKFLTSKYSYLGIFILIAGFFLMLFAFYKMDQLDDFLRVQTKEAKNRYQGITLFPKDTSDFIFRHLINTSEVKEIFKDAKDADASKQDILRKRLYNHLKDVYSEIKKYNIQQLHFHLPNNESFLRFHKPEKFGDNLSEHRKTVAYVNEHKVFVEGFEEGKIFNGYRFVYPMFYINNGEKVHIGSVEISHSIKSFQDIYQRAFNNIYLDFLISRKVVTQKVFEDEFSNYEPSLINSDFLHQKCIGISQEVVEASKLASRSIQVQERMKAYKDFSISVAHGNHYGVISFVAIHNPITQEKVAYAISFEKSEYLTYFYKDRNLEALYLVLAAIVLTLLIFYVVKFNQELKSKVYKDSLLQIYNRRFFETYLLEAIKRQKRAEVNLSLVMFDVDYFKKINDNYGHDIGDMALKLLAKIVKENIRESDVFARWGGEEFVLLFESDMKTTHRLVENLRLLIQKYTKDYKKVPEMTCSFGILNLAQTKSLEEALKKVDEKLYEAKQSGRNKVVV